MSKTRYMTVSVRLDSEAMRRRLDDAIKNGEIRIELRGEVTDDALNEAVPCGFTLD